MVRKINLSNIRVIKFAAVLGVLAIAGCASEGAKPEKSAAAAPAATKPTKPSRAAVAPAPKIAFPAAGKDQGTVVFFRERKFAGSAVSFIVRENNVELGKLSSGAYFVVNLPKGPHKFEVHSEAKDELNMEVDPGETYYFIGTISMGFMVGHPHLQPSTATEFDSMSAKLKASSLSASK